MMEWDSGGVCPRCGGELEEEERAASGLATISEVRRAMEEIAAAEAEAGDPAVGDAFLNKPGDMVGGREFRRVDDLFGRMPAFIEVWRAVGLREGETLDEDDLGGSWTWDRKSAEAYNRPADAGDIVVAHGEVARGDVDWPSTYALNILFPTEREVRLPRGTDVELLDVDGRRVGRWVRASGRIPPAQSRHGGVTAHRTVQNPRRDMRRGYGSRRRATVSRRVANALGAGTPAYRHSRPSHS